MLTHPARGSRRVFRALESWMEYSKLISYRSTIKIRSPYEYVGCLSVVFSWQQADWHAALIQTWWADAPPPFTPSLSLCRSLHLHNHCSAS